MKPVRTWIVIADGARARVLQNNGPGKGLEALPDLMLEGEHLRAGEVMADKPGRTFDSVGTGRHAMEPPTDPHEALKVQFAQHVADTLEQRADGYDRLILVAPPAALGHLRKSLASGVAGKIVGELGKDLTHLPNTDVPDHLNHLLVL